MQAQFFDLSIDTRQVIEDDLEGFRQLPGVINATTTSQIPFSAEAVSQIYLEVGDEPQAYQTNIFDLDINGIEVLGLEVIEGRQFSPTEVIRHDPSLSDARPAVVMISHELNNSLAPISSMTNSAKKILKQREHLDLLPEILDTIERRTQRLFEFTRQYARLARKQPVMSATFLAISKRSVS